MPSVIPSSLLPALPRAKWTLEPLTANELLGHMAVLKELYMPPIHGGFTAGDVELDEADTAANGQKRRPRTMSGGSVDLVPGLGLEMEGLGLENVAEEGEDEDYDGQYESESDDDNDEHNDPFEREWAEKWLNGVVRRAQTWLEANDAEAERDELKAAETETVLREATAVLALMAGASAAGSVTRHLLFPLAPELAPALRALRATVLAPNPSLSPQTSNFLSSLATSPVSPVTTMRSLPTQRKRGDSMSSSGSRRSRRGRMAALPVLLHDAHMADHLSVGVQTWGSAILLGREMALRPADFGLFQDNLPHGGGTRVLELGAGTGLLSILCRKLLDLRAATAVIASPGKAPTTPPSDPGIVVATDFLPDVIANLRVCVDLNAPPKLPGTPAAPGINIAKLDWTTFPRYMEKRAGWIDDEVEDEELAPWIDQPFDLVLASDCVYDPTHAALLRRVAGWVLRPPSATYPGGTMHLLSPIRPTFTPELESIDVAFPNLSSYAPLSERTAAAGRKDIPPSLQGEGLGVAQGLRIGVRGTGKRSVKGRKGEGRTDENSGYWWWEVGWG